MPSPIIKKDAVAAKAHTFDTAYPVASTILRGDRVDVHRHEEHASAPAGRIVRAGEARLTAQPVELKLLAGHDATRGPGDPDDSTTLPLSPEEALARREEAWKTEMEEAVAAARAEGYEAGARETRDALEQAHQEALRPLRADVERLQTLWHELAAKSEPILLEMMMDLVEAILHQPLPEPVGGIAEETLLTMLEAFAREAPIRLSLNSIDYLRLQESGLEAQMASLFPHLSWDPQPDLREGDWIAQSPEQMVRHIVSESINHFKDRFGLLEPHSRIARLGAAAPGAAGRRVDDAPDAPPLDADDAPPLP